MGAYLHVYIREVARRMSISRCISVSYMRTCLRTQIHQHVIASCNTHFYTYTRAYTLTYVFAHIRAPSWFLEREQLCSCSTYTATTVCLHVLLHLHVYARACVCLCVCAQYGCCNFVLFYLLHVCVHVFVCARAQCVCFKDGYVVASI